MIRYQSWLDDLDQERERFITLRRYLHENPEPSFEEINTANVIAETLTSFGFKDIKRNVGNGYGIIATLNGAHAGPTIALRADFDALRIHEETDLEFASKNPGIMHACGHDVHTASLLSVAQVLSLHVDELHGTVVFIFQNAEEVIPGGAKSMVEAGALEGVEAIFGIHSASMLPVGSFGYRYGYSSAAADFFKIEIQGKGGHGANPHESVDSVIVASSIVTQLQTLISRSIDPTKPAVLTFGGVKAGGTAYNVIADKALLSGTVRTLHEPVRQIVKNGIIEYAQTLASMRGAQATITYRDGYPSLLNTDAEMDAAVQALETLWGTEQVQAQPLSMGGEDFAYYVQKVPGAFFNVGGGNPDIDAVYPHHHPKFKLDERCIYNSAASFLAIVSHYLQKD